MSQVQISQDKYLEEEREKDRFEYRIYAEFSNDIAERVDIRITYYPIKKYYNHVTLSLSLYLSNGIVLEMYRSRDSWSGSGLDFRNKIVIYTTQEFDDTAILARERYEKINSVEDVKKLIEDIMELYKDFVEYYICNEVEEFINIAQ